MVCGLAEGEGDEGCVVINAVVQGTVATMGIVGVVPAAVGAKGDGEPRPEAEEAVEAGEVV